MGLPTTIEAITVILIVFIPGYVFLQFSKRAVAHLPQAVDARYFFAVISWGGAIHAAASFWTIPLIRWYRQGEINDHTVYLLIWGVVVLFVGPTFLGALGAWIVIQPRVDKILEFTKMDYISRTPSAWEYAIRTGPAYIRIQLKDGSMVGGMYGGDSFSDPTGAQDIFLERAYILDENGDFVEAVPNNVGVWIPHDEIQLMIFSREPEGEFDNGNNEEGFYNFSQDDE